MSAAHLYIRVSTDEQADKGYSQRNQDEVLRRYCQLNNIQIAQVIYEDHSAKTFKRPAWQNMLRDLKKRKRNDVSLILFTKWDRFSRNAGDAYQMIALLRQFGIEPQAIEQPLDLSIPENKMMLAFYLAAPEVENDRRALNIFHGMRRARKEGRWTSSAPLGYVNRSYEDGRKYIAVNEPQAGIMRWIFETIAAGNHRTQQVWQEARKKGLNCGKSNFWNLIRNPVYCGQIAVPAFKDETPQLVNGQHEAIISETLFYKAQRALDGRKRAKRTFATPELLPLRGFLKCPSCSRMLTGSASKGSSEYYSYYHCTGKCKARFRADELNQLFIEQLTPWRSGQALGKLFKKLVVQCYQERHQLEIQRQALAERQTADMQKQLDRAQQLLLSGDLEPTEYRDIKQQLTERLTSINHAIGKQTVSVEAITKQLDKAKLSALSPGSLFQRANTVQKRKILTMILRPPIKINEQQQPAVSFQSWFSKVLKQ